MSGVNPLFRAILGQWLFSLSFRVSRVAGLGPRISTWSILPQTGQPVIQKRCENGNRLVQLCRARMVTDRGKLNYCMLRLDGNDRCDEFEFAVVAVSTTTNPEQAE